MPEEIKIGERMAKIEEKQDALKESFDEFKLSYKEDMTAIKEGFKEFISSADKRYANKETEEFVKSFKRGVIALATIIGFAILAAIISHVLGLNIK